MAASPAKKQTQTLSDSRRVHAFGQDALGEHDAVALAALVRKGEVRAFELAQAAIARAGKVNGC